MEIRRTRRRVGRTLGPAGAVMLLLGCGVVVAPYHAGAATHGLRQVAEVDPAAAADATGPGPGPAVIHRIGSIRPRTQGITNTEISTNWSGQIATGATYTSIQGNWTVPTVVPSFFPRFSATWIGIDGVAASSLIQTGTSQNTANDSTGYFAWVELLPHASVTLPDAPVSPGDAMHASITETGAALWTVVLEDFTQGWTYDQQMSYSTPGLSAEWIEEAPTIDGGQSTLADFTSATFTDVSTTAVGSSTYEPVAMADATDGTIIAYTHPFTPSTQAFTVYYGSPPTSSTGYDLVGSDGGVFVFGGGFYGSLPGLGIHVDDITGIVPTSTDTGYFLVGSDGGVFAFNAPFENSLPGIGVHVDDIVGIVPTLDDQGYFLVGSDGGVFAFNAPFENSLPGMGIHVNDIVGIAATADDQGYWLIASDGTVYALGDATSYGNAPPGAVGITVTPTGDGYWVVGANGAVTARGDALDFGGLPDIGVSVDDIVGIVVSSDGLGYNLFGSDGGVFSFGDAGNLGSLPGLGVTVDNVVGAVPT